MFIPCPPKAEVTSSNLVGRATSVHAIDAKRRRSCASTADKGGWKFRLGAARVEGRPTAYFRIGAAKDRLGGTNQTGFAGRFGRPSRPASRAFTCGPWGSIVNTDSTLV